MIMICSVLWDLMDLIGSGGSDGGLGAVDPNAGIYPNIQVIQPFLSGAIDPIKVQYWDQTYYWGPDSDGNDACFKGTVGIEDSSSLAQETAPGPECPTSLGQVTPCNPAAAADTVASGAVQPAISGCERDGAACTDILVPDITDEVTCESTVRQADPIAAGAAWFQNIDAPGTKGGTASHWWYGTRANKSFDAEDGYGGTQIDYISDATNINIAASGGGSGPTTRVNNIYLCSNKDVVNPAESPDVCTLSSLFGSCGYTANGDVEACKINNIGLVDGAYNVFIRSATPSVGFGFGGVEDPDSGANAFMPSEHYVMITFDDGFPRSTESEDASAKVQLLTELAQMTYFATAQFSSDLSTFEDWYQAGNEIANHTVSHLRGGGDLSVAPFDDPGNWSNAEIAYDTTRWTNEITDMASILDIWSNVPPSAITGFRAPQLLLNRYVFKGYANYIAAQTDSGGKNYYDSSLRYDPGSNIKLLQPPKKLTADNYCSKTPKFFISPDYMQNDDQCTELLNYFGGQHPIADAIWEIPIPQLPGAPNKGLMVLPNCVDTKNCSTPPLFDDFITSWLDPSNVNPTPLLISIHESQLKDDATQWFVPWAQNHVSPGGKIKFVTVQCVVDMYAAGEKLPCADAVAKPMGNAGDWYQCNIGTQGFAYSQPITNLKAFGVFPFCNLNCGDANYGQNCYARSGAPPTSSSLTFTTKNACGGPVPPVKVSSLPPGYGRGAYPWVGNPLGNSTIGTSCNTFPDVRNPLPPVAPVCINKRDASGNYPSFTKGDATITANTCVMYNTETYLCNVSAAQAANCYERIPGSTAAANYWILEGS